MERLNLNIPAEARARLRVMAAANGRKEGELARELLLDALDRAQREEFFRRVAQAQSPELRARLLEITNAMEQSRGQAR